MITKTAWLEEKITTIDCERWRTTQLSTVAQLIEQDFFLERNHWMMAGEAFDQ